MAGDENGITDAAHKSLPDWVDELADKFDAAWCRGPRPSIRDFLGNVEGKRRLFLLKELIKIDMEYRWKAGNDKSLTAYAGEFPELYGEQGRIPADLLAYEAALRTALGIDSDADGEISDSPGEEIVEPRAPFGDQLGEYKIISNLGEGGMGTVYEALQASLNRKVALKILPLVGMERPQYLSRFQREAEAAAALNHPNIVTLYEVGEERGFHFIAMEFIDGESLDKTLRREGKLPVAKALDYIIQAARGLAHAWERDVIHRDIKPGNLMVTRDGIVKITDFGLAKLRRSDSSLTTSSQALGTPYYMSPEQVISSKNVDFRTDIYSLGATFYHLVTGKVPISGSTPFDVANRVVTEEPPPAFEINPDIPHPVSLLIERMLQKDPQARFNSPGELLEALEGLKRGIESGQYPLLEHAASKLPSSEKTIPLPSEDDFHNLRDLRDASTVPASTVPRAEKKSLWWLGIAAGIVILAGIYFYLIPGASRGDGRDGKTGAVSRGTRGTNKKNGQGAVKAATTSSTIPRARLPDDFGEEDQDRLPGPDMPRPVARKPAQRLSILGWIEAKGDIGGIALAPDDSRIYVAYRGGPQGASIEEFLCETGKLLRRFPFPAPDCLQDDLAISNDGRYLFAANYYKDYVSRLDLTQNGLETRQKVHGSPQNVWAAFVQKSPDGIRLVVCAGEDGRVEDLDNDQISIYDIAGKNFKFLGKVILPDEPLVRSLGFTSDSSLVYVPTFRRKSAQDKLYEIRLTPPYEIARSISFPHAELASVVVHDPTRRIFLGDRLNKKIWVIDQEKLEVVSEISLQGRRVDAMELSPDGSVLYAISPTDRSLWAFDAYTLSEIEHLGGLRRDPKDIEISRDGARLFVAHGTDGGIAVIRGIKPCRGDGTILFSSDIHGNYQVFKLPTGSQEPVRLTRNFATELIPRWSPHGRLIAFISDRDGPFKIFLMDENGQNTKPLENTATSGSTEYGGIDWSPDGQQIAFIGQDQKSIRIVDVRDGSTSTILSGPIMGRYNHYAGISWKWDPERIVFGAFPAGNADSEEIFEVNIKSHKVSKVSGDEGQIGHYHMPALAPDKTTIAAERIITKPTGAEWDIVLFRGRGKKPFINLTMTPSRDALPRWSHDGKKIVFALQKTQRFHVWSMNADGTAAEPLTSGDANNIFPDIR